MTVATGGMTPAPAALVPWTPQQNGLPVPPCRPSAACCRSRHCLLAPARRRCPLQTSCCRHRRRRWTSTCRAAQPPLDFHHSLTCGATGHRPQWTTITAHPATTTTPSFPTTSPPAAAVPRAVSHLSHCRQSWPACSLRRPPVPRTVAARAMAAGRLQVSTAAVPAVVTPMPLRPPCLSSAHWASEETRAVWAAPTEGAEVDRRPAGDSSASRPPLCPHPSPCPSSPTCIPYPSTAAAFRKLPTTPLRPSRLRHTSEKDTFTSNTNTNYIHITSSTSRSHSTSSSNRSISRHFYSHNTFKYSLPSHSTQWHRRRRRLYPSLPR